MNKQGSILNLSGNSAKKNIKVVHFIEDVMLIVLQQHSKGEQCDQYYKLILQLRKNEIENDRLLSWLQQLKDNINVIGPRTEDFVAELLKVKWPNTDENIVAEYKLFIPILVSANTSFLRLVLRTLVGHFVPDLVKEAYNYCRILNEECESSENNDVYENIHDVLKTVLSVAPTTPKVLLPILSELFPYIKKGPTFYTCYIINLLKITDYIPIFRRDVLEIIIDKIIKIDVHCPRHEIEEVELSQMNNSDDDIMDFSEECKPIKMAHDLAETMDVSLNIIFNYIKKFCFNGESINVSNFNSLSKDFINIFDKVVLPTHGSCHVQYILFYLCSLNNKLCTTFLDQLWKKFVCPNTPIVIRQSSIAYVSSLLTRGAFISISTAKYYLERMSLWINQYINAQEYLYVNPAQHGSFYSMCQAFFYIFAFRHKEFWESAKGPAFLQSLCFEKIISCNLNPLKYCHPVVLRNFASVTRNYQLAYCFTIIEKNARAKLPLVVEDLGQSAYQNQLELYFPFDPIILIRTGKFINPIYRQYEGKLEEMDEEEPLEMEHEDFMAELKSNSPASVDMFFYGSYPGFKL